MHCASLLGSIFDKLRGGRLHVLGAVSRGSSELGKIYKVYTFIVLLCVTVLTFASHYSKV